MEKVLKQDRKDRVVHPSESSVESVSSYWQLTQRGGGRRKSGFAVRFSAVPREGSRGGQSPLTICLGAGDKAGKIAVENRKETRDAESQPSVATEDLK